MLRWKDWRLVPGNPRIWKKAVPKAGTARGSQLCVTPPMVFPRISHSLGLLWPGEVAPASLCWAVGCISARPRLSSPLLRGQDRSPINSVLILPSRSRRAVITASFDAEVQVLCPRTFCMVYVSIPAHLLSQILRP